ncbi:MAG TPA: class I SAM-dependent methyltransferase [Spirochaetota bacterium]|nr:class I SAM-dependent methyltransferase [Spirochaetota bacterium]HPJ42665.1 class I SAM-dependent methyltransferase [Spirochaetota bacterium]
MSIHRMDKERGFWSSFAPKYDTFMKRVGPAYERIVQLIENEVDPADYVLEAACGTGLISMRIAPYVDRYFGCDISPEMIEIARSKALSSGISNIEFSVQDAYSPDFPDDFFDAVILANALHIMIEPEIVLAKIKHILKSEGLLIIPTYLHGSSLLSRSISSIMGLSGFRAYHRWSAESFEQFIESCGYTILRSISIKDKIPLQYISAVKND